MLSTWYTGLWFYVSQHKFPQPLTFIKKSQDNFIERKHSIVINLAISLRDKYYSHVDKKYLKTIELAQSESNFFELLESMFSDLQNLYLIYNFAIFKKPSGFDNIIDYELLAKLCEPFKKN